MSGETMKVFLLLIPVLLFSSGAFSTAAKDAPLIAQLSGDLWSWNGTWKRLTHWGGNSNPVLAPDGANVAYFSLAAGAPDCEGIAGGGCGGFAFRHNNVSVLELGCGKARQVAGQPAALNAQNWNKIGITRAGLAWSPDRTRLAWTEQSVRDFQRQSDLWDMVPYTVATRKTERFKIRETRYRDDQSMTLHWNARGLGLVWPNSLGEARRWYSPAGQLLEPELKNVAGPKAKKPALFLRCPRVAAASCSLLSRAKTPLKLNMHAVTGVVSADGSRAVLKGFGTDGDSTGYQLWLYKSGKLTRIALPKPVMKDNSIELSWFGEIPWM
jgi:hypothetical protein